MSDTARMNIGVATSSSLATALPDVTVAQKTTDGATGSEETLYTHDDWEKWYGYYCTIPEVKTAIDTRAIWTCGKKWRTNDAEAKVVLEHISGYGQDTFQTILQNMIVTNRICGDAFAEIIRDEESNTLMNLKCLDPSTITIVADKKGIIKEYRQNSKTVKGSYVKFKPYEIFHLVNKRVADNIHGVSDIEAIEEIIKAYNENSVDMKKVYHRFVRPMVKFELDTDDSTKIASFKATNDKAVADGENLYIPMGTAKHELITIPSSSVLSPFQWRDDMRTRFYQTVGIPQIVLGNASEFSESSAKIAYLSFQQSVEAEQLYIENQVWNQLYLEIELDFPASIQNEMISDTSKDGENQQTGFQPSDTTLNMANQGGGQ